MLSCAGVDSRAVVVVLVILLVAVAIVVTLLLLAHVVEGTATALTLPQSIQSMPTNEHAVRKSNSS